MSNTQTQQLLQAGITAFKEGRKLEARQFLLQAVQLEPENQMALLWLAGCVTNSQQQQQLLERAIAADPQSAAARRAAQALDQMTKATSLDKTSSSVQQAEPQADLCIASVSQASELSRKTEREANPIQTYAAPASHVSESTAQPVQSVSSPITPLQKKTPLPSPTVRVNWIILTLSLAGSILIISIIGNIFGAGGVFLFVLGTSIWVFFDARSLGIGRVAEMEKLGAFGWFVCCLLLWIVFFPVYLSKRDSFKQVYGSMNKRLSQRHPETATSQQRLSGSAILGMFIVFIICGIGVLAALGSVPDGTASENAQAVIESEATSDLQTSAAVSETPDDPYKITKLDAQWRLNRDEALWIPELRMQILNVTDQDLSFQLEARFLDSENVMVAHNATVVEIYAGYTVDAWLKSYMGLTSDWPFLSMADDESLNWHYELFGRQDARQEWQKITSGGIELPPGYRDTFSNDADL